MRLAPEPPKAGSAPSDAFLDRFAALPAGYSEGLYRGRRYGVTVRMSEDGRRSWLFGEALGGGDHVSCNLYRLGERTLLKPCEMAPDKVIDFVLAFQPVGQPGVRPAIPAPQVRADRKA
ncbi:MULTISPECIES: hypothetical protein [unclassified Aureimonas]|uniref:hypothetical protein n=1 Tax=unclassified Aureimonas TaxID=2615206 RepID=UPI0006FE356E|nr:MULTISPECIES: hypothetical protein [unclassified Aureimonas]KQT64014.1 hypothetical protein ASG62_03070 [Aureimonas sp. Leaf427]KQT81207.1 hypothetical protein ASG54_00340 [Aureimonas sp. Leaf460]